MVLQPEWTNFGGVSGLILVIALGRANYLRCLDDFGRHHTRQHGSFQDGNWYVPTKESGEGREGREETTSKQTQRGLRAQDVIWMQ